MGTEMMGMWTAKSPIVFPYGEIFEPHLIGKCCLQKKKGRKIKQARFTIRGNNPCNVGLQADKEIHGGKAGWMLECVLSLV